VDSRLNESRLTIDSIPKLRDPRRSYSLDKCKKTKIYDLIATEPHKSKIFLDARKERKDFHNHLEKLKIAHQKQLDTVKHIVLDISDQIVTKKIVGFQQAINKEIKNIFEYISTLKEHIHNQTIENLRIWEKLLEYENIATEKTIK